MENMANRRECGIIYWDVSQAKSVKIVMWTTKELNIYDNG